MTSPRIVTVDAPILKGWKYLPSPGFDQLRRIKVLLQSTESSLSPLINVLPSSSFTTTARTNSNPNIQMSDPVDFADQTEYLSA